MKSLQEFLDIGKQWHMNDYQVIELFLCQDASKSAELLYKVLSNRVEELEVFEHDTKALMSQGSPYYYKNFDYETASRLDTLTRKMMMQMKFNDKDIEFMKAFDLNKLNSCFWHDLAEAIKSTQIDGYKSEYYNYKGRLL